ncbi:MAG: hypothetical protein JST92_25890, partial [Deltaproteobacteria bacterium]|nr:hypothetical protein [Deltaproteobacteria bacterium]
MAVAVRCPSRALALALALWGGVALAAGPQPAPVIAEGVLESGRLAPQWTDLGWAPHELVAGRPVGVELGGGAGLILLRDGQIPQFGGLLLRLKVQPELLESLEIGLDAKGGASFPRVNLSGQWSAPLADGFSEHWVAMSALNPQRTSFDRLVLRGLPDVGALRVELAAIGWTREAPPEKPDPAATAPRAVSVTLDCGRRRPINPMIYGVSVGDPRVAAALGASARRWGGNISTRYNWKLKSWNTGNDWYFRNVSNPNSESWEQALKDDHARGVSSAFVVPLIGWVAKDDKSCSFPMSAETKQQKFDPSKSGCGNGVS